MASEICRSCYDPTKPDLHRAVAEGCVCVCGMALCKLCDRRGHRNCAGALRVTMLERVSAIGCDSPDPQDDAGPVPTNTPISDSIDVVLDLSRQVRAALKENAKLREQCERATLANSEMRTGLEEATSVVEELTHELTLRQKRIEEADERERALIERYETKIAELTEHAPAKPAKARVVIRRPSTPRSDPSKTRRLRSKK